jgi:hypothetical protein
MIPISLENWGLPVSCPASAAVHHSDYSKKAKCDSRWDGRDRRIPKYRASPAYGEPQPGNCEVGQGLTIMAASAKRFDSIASNLS